MRYQDWDVLLFPSGEESAHVPVKEFKTACYVEHLDSIATTTPLLTSFIPTLTRNTPFQISIHSWLKTGPVGVFLRDGTRPKEVWQVRVVIDGICVRSETLPIDANWPQVISSTSPLGPETQQLRFPQFHRTIMSESHWNPSDRVGRIRVELSSGYHDAGSGHFVKIANVVTFAYQAAPMRILEHNGIAWPNNAMFVNPLQSNARLGAPANGFTNNPDAIKHRRAASTNNINVHAGLNGLPVQPSAGLLNPYALEQYTNYDGSSRSTSAYSIFTDSNAPLLNKFSFVPAYPGTHADTTRQSEQMMANQGKFRLSSDQLQQILQEIRSTGQQQAGTSPTTTMPPPPLPLHAIASKDNAGPGQRTTIFDMPGNLHFGSDANFIDRRGDSRYSDISMHAGCTGFPTCTTEDDEGRLVHNTNTNNTPAAPATVVRGRKEGSSPTKPRDFFETILGTSAAEEVPLTTASTETSLQQTAATATGLFLESSSPPPSKKRTRSALRSLNINDGGSPEKNKDAGKPPRKASRASNNSDQENVNVSDGQENMVLDA